jgi:NADPH-dependent curcumin reductase
MNKQVTLRSRPEEMPSESNFVIVQSAVIPLDHTDRMPAFLRDMSQWLREGKVRYREDIVHGLENALCGFIALLQGENVGKRIIQVAPDPTRKEMR